MRRTTVWMVVFALLTMACSLGSTATTMPPPTSQPPTQGAVAGGGAESTGAPPTPAPTSIPVHAAGECTLNAEFVADITVPDNTLVQPGTAFRKTWRVRNNGSCAWPAGTHFVFVSGDPMGASPSILAPAAEAGSEAEVSVDFVAPTAPGTYRSTWQLESPDGTRFGQLFYVQIVVPQPESATSAPPATTEVPTTPTPAIVLCPAALAPDFATLYAQAESAGLDLGCTTQDAGEIYAATQEFWANVGNPNPHMHYRSLMLWRSDTKQIYVITVSETGLDSFSVYPDTWTEGLPEEPPACSGMTVPTGYIMPIRGFGKVWCEHHLYDSIGWPQEAEIGLNILIQPTERGILLRATVASGSVYEAALESATGKAYVILHP